MERLSKTWYAFRVGYFVLVKYLLSLHIQTFFLFSIVQISDALETYTADDDEHKSFAFMHCWYKLKDEDKWKSWRLEQGTKQKQAPKRKQKSTKDSTPSTGDEKNNAEGLEVPDAGSAERKRPPGQKEAKKAKWGGNDACSVVLDKMMEKKEARDKEREKAREATAQVDKDSIEAEKKLAEATLMKEEKDIMLADTSSLDDQQLQWIQIMRKKILARHAEN